MRALQRSRRTRSSRASSSASGKSGSAPPHDRDGAGAAAGASPARRPASAQSARSPRSAVRWSAGSRDRRRSSSGRHSGVRVYRAQAQRRSGERDAEGQNTARPGRKVLVIAGNQARVVPDYTLPPGMAGAKSGQADRVGKRRRCKPTEPVKLDQPLPDVTPAEGRPRTGLTPSWPRRRPPRRGRGHDKELAPDPAIPASRFRKEIRHEATPETKTAPATTGEAEPASCGQRSPWRRPSATGR